MSSQREFVGYDDVNFDREKAALFQRLNEQGPWTQADTDSVFDKLLSVTTIMCTRERGISIDEVRAMLMRLINHNRNNLMAYAAFVRGDVDRHEYIENLIARHREERGDHEDSDEAS